MPRSRTIAIALLGATLLTAPAARAEAIERHFRAPAYDCPSGPYSGLAAYVAEWRIHGDTDDGLTVEAYWRGTDRSRFEGQQWWIDGVQGFEDVHLADRRDRALFRIPDLLADPPELQVLDRDGEPRADCVPRLEPTTPAAERVDALLALLGTEAPTPEDAAAVREAWDARPPPQLVGSDGGSLLREVEEARAGFEERLRTATLAAAADPEGADVVGALVQAWLGGDEPRLPRADAELLLEAQRARAVTLAAAGRDPAEALAAATPEALCARLAGLAGRRDWEERLELVTGLPLGHWTRERAEALRDRAGACPGGEDLAGIIAERWPAIEARGAQARWLAAERDRILAVPLTLEAVAAADWLELDFTALTRRGLSVREAEEALGPALAAHRAAAAETLAEELVAEIEAGDVPLEEHPVHCPRRLSAPELGGAGELRRAVAEACTTRAVEAFEEAVRARLREREAAAGDAVEDGAAAAGEGGGEGLARFDLAPLRHPLAVAWDAGGPFREAASRLLAELDAAEARTEPAYRAALAAVLAEVEAAHAGADPAEGDIMAVAPACAAVLGPDPSTGTRLAPLLELCGRLGRTRRAAAEAAACDRLWEEARAPEGMRGGLVALPHDVALSSGVATATLEEIVCLGQRDGFDVAIEGRRGLLSSEHRLVHRMEGDGASVVVSARLVPPAEEGGPWTLADGLAQRGEGDERPLAGPSDRLLACVLSPAECREVTAP